MRSWKKPCRLTEVLDDGKSQVTCAYAGGVRKARSLLRTGIEWGRLLGGVIEHEGAREIFKSTSEGEVEVQVERVEPEVAA